MSLTNLHRVVLLVLFASASSSQLQATDRAPSFTLELRVADAAGNATTLQIGTAVSATSGFDAGLDRFAPPPPPAGSFFAHANAFNETLLADFRPLTEDSTRWVIRLGASSAAYPISITWNTDSLKTHGTVRMNMGGISHDLRKNGIATITNPSLSELEIVHSLWVEHSTPVTEGWNLVGMPSRPDSDIPYVLYPTAIEGTAYRFDGAYKPASSMERGIGYWLRSASDTQARVSGLLVAHNTFALKAGWNLITPVSQTRSVNHLIDPDGILAGSSIFAYAGGYVSTDSLRPGRGYWVQAASEGNVSLMIPVPGEAAAGKRYATAEDETDLSEFGRLLVKSGDASQTLYFGAVLPSHVSPLRYSLPPMPPAGAFDARIHRDTRLSEADSIWVRVQPSDSHPLEVEFAAPPAYSERSYVVHEQRHGVPGKRHLVDSGDTVTLQDSEVDALLVYPLTTTSSETLASSAGTSVVALFPNPASESTTLTFSLQEGGPVRLELFDIRGRRVAILVDGPLAPGLHVIDVMTSRMTSGVYAYRLSAPSVVKSGSLIVLH